MQLIQNFRRLHDDKTSIMEWYSSKNSHILSETNIQGEPPNGQMSGEKWTQSELKFQPVINKRSKVLDSCLQLSTSGMYSSGKEGDRPNAEGKNRFELLYEHSKYMEQKRKEQQDALQREKKNSCTFQPSMNAKSMAINASKSLNDTETVRTSVHDKLYQKHLSRSEFKDEQRLQATLEKEKNELQACTFRPIINYPIPSSIRPEENDRQVISIKGVQQQLERLQKARQLQVEKDSYFERQRQILSQNASRFTETLPFSFDQSGNSQRVGNMSMRKEREILGNVDVNFSKGKKGRIIIYKGDQPEELALNFVKIYSLSDDMRFTLCGMLTDYIAKIEQENLQQMPGSRESKDIQDGDISNLSEEGDDQSENQKRLDELESAQQLTQQIDVPQEADEAHSLKLDEQMEETYINQNS